MFLFLRKQNPEIVSMVMCSTYERDTILAASSKDFTKDMSRVKSSNIWSRKINIKDTKDKYGDVYVQFKGKNGGPDDVYVYYDVPVFIYRKWITAPSAGHFFWQHIRNKYKYSKLTGDKRGKLKNAINHTVKR